MKLIKAIALFCALFVTYTLSATDIGGNITVDSTLSVDDSPYLITTDLVVDSGVTLTIEPGVAIEFPATSRDIVVYGILIAEGNSGDSIRFFSDNGSGGGSLVLHNGAVASLDYVALSDLGRSTLTTYDTGLRLFDADLSMSNCSFTDCGTSGVNMRARPNYICGIDQSNSLDLVYLDGDTIDNNCIWTRMDLADFEYVMTGDVVVEDGVDLYLEAGLNILFESTGDDLIVHGTLYSTGLPTDSVYFSSNSGTGGGSLVLMDGSAAQISYTAFSDMGRSTLTQYDTGLRIFDSEVSLESSSFVDCGTSSASIRTRPDRINGFGTDLSLDEIVLDAITLDQSSTWSNVDPNGFTYRFSGDISLPAGDTLTLMPGIEVDLELAGIDLLIEGHLEAVGTPTDSIHLYGTSAAGGGSLALLDGASALIRYVAFNDLGRSTLTAYDTGMRVFDAEPDIDHASFTDCGTSSISIRMRPDRLNRFGDQVLVDNVRLDAITLDKSSVWPDMDPSGFVYILAGDITVPAGDTLTIEPAVRMDLDATGKDLFIEGYLSAEGTETDSIFFFSSAADGGGSVVMRDGSAGSILYVDFLLLGYSSLSAHDTGLRIFDAELSLDHSRFTLCGTSSASIRSRADRLGQLGEENELDFIFLDSGTLDQSSVWPDVDSTGFDYVMTGDITCGSGDTLWIQPGVHVDFALSSYDLLIDGHLVASALPTDSIRLFSSGANGGGSMALRDGSSAVLSFVKLQDLGRNSLSNFDTGLRIFDSQVEMQHSSFENCGTSAASIRTRPDRIGLMSSTNEVDFVFMDAMVLDTTSYWPIIDSLGFDYVTTGPITVSQGDSLRIAPGVSVDFRSRNHDLLIQGHLSANGLDTDSITLYSSSANGGGSIALQKGASAEISYSEIYMLGSSSLSAYDACVHIDSADVSLEKSVVSLSQSGIRVIEGQPTIQFNIIKGNYPYGLFNHPDNDVVTACGNYWGDPSGPYNASNNPFGLGDAVTDNVIAAECAAGPLEIVCPANATVFVGDEYDPTKTGMAAICIKDCPGDAEISYSDDLLDPQCSEDLIRTWTAVDTCGNEFSCEQVITFIDTIAPTITCTDETYLECNAIVPDADPSALDVSDNCGVDFVELSGETEEVEGCVHTYTYFYTVYDLSGNSASCSESFIVEEDLVGPVLSEMPSDITVACTDFPAAPTITATDDCAGAVTVDFIEIPNTDPCMPGLTRIWTAIDPCGNETSHTQVITGEFGSMVFEGVPNDTTLECDESIPDSFVSAANFCGAATVTMTQESDGLSCSETITRTWTAVDDCGNTGTAVQVITIEDTTPPVFDSVADDITVECGQVIPSASASVSDICGSANWTVQEDVTETCGQTFVLQRTYTAIDECGNTATASQIITIVDTTAPVFTDVPVDVTIECGEATPSDMATAIDACGDVSVTLQESGAAECDGLITRTWTAIDECGNTATATQVVTIVDSSAPFFTDAPSDVAIECGDALPPVASVSAADDCDPEVDVEFLESGSTDCGSQVIRQWTATDDCGNQVTHTQTISILDADDIFLIGVPDDATVECDAIPTPASVTAAGGCSAPVVTFSETAGTGICFNTITRTWTANDDCGNTATASQEITVIDSTPPMLEVGEDTTVECSESFDVVSYTASDNCSSFLVEIDSTFTPTCGQTGQWEITYTATDECGNQTVATQSVTVIDSTPPVLTVGADDTVECGTSFDLVDYTVSDECGDVTVSIDTTFTAACGATGEYVIEYTATDECGNQSSETQTITIIDTQSPILQGVPADEVVDCPEDVPAPAMVTATDECEGEVTVDFIEVEDGGVITRIWSSTDACANTASAAQTIVVLDECEEDCSAFATAPVGLTKSYSPNPYLSGDIDRVQLKWYKDLPKIKYSIEDNAACDIQFWRNYYDTWPDNEVEQDPDTTLIPYTKVQKDGVEMFKWPIKFKFSNGDNPVQPNASYRWRVRCYCNDGLTVDGNGLQIITPWSAIKSFNTPDFDPATGIYTPPGGLFNGPDDEVKSLPSIYDGMVSIYPNPSNGEFWLDAPFDQYMVKVMDTNGREVYREQVRSGVHLLQVNGLGAGIYVVEILSEGGVDRYPVVIRP